MPLYDCHCHSEHSPDSKMTIREIVEKSIELGFKGVAMTNHYDPIVPSYSDDVIELERVNILRSFDEICDLRDEYSDRIKIFCGAELGSPFRAIEKCNTILSDSRLDVVIGSVHVLTPTFNDGTSRAYNPFRERDPDDADRIIEAYFTDVFHNIAFCDIDTVGHISYLQRYIVKDGVAPYNVKRYIDACADVMKAAISRNIAVELNAKSVSICDNVPFSELDFFRLYRDLGGKLVTIGSDAHSIDQFKDVFAAAQLLKAAGFESACYYEGRCPVFYSLD